MHIERATHTPKRQIHAVGVDTAHTHNSLLKPKVSIRIGQTTDGSLWISKDSATASNRPLLDQQQKSSTVIWTNAKLKRSKCPRVCVCVCV